MCLYRFGDAYINFENFVLFFTSTHYYSCNKYKVILYVKVISFNNKKLDRMFKFLFKWTIVRMFKFLFKWTIVERFLNCCRFILFIVYSIIHMYCICSVHVQIAMYGTILQIFMTIRFEYCVEMKNLGNSNLLGFTYINKCSLNYCLKINFNISCLLYLDIRNKLIKKY